MRALRNLFIFVLCFRFPEAFETFGSFRKFFPMVSSYCFCADSRGRELDSTGTHTVRNWDDDDDDGSDDDEGVYFLYRCGAPPV